MSASHVRDLVGRSLPRLLRLGAVEDCFQPAAATEA